MRRSPLTHFKIQCLGIHYHHRTCAQQVASAKAAPVPATDTTNPVALIATLAAGGVAAYFAFTANKVGAVSGHSVRLHGCYVTCHLVNQARLPLSRSFVWLAAGHTCIGWPYLHGNASAVFQSLRCPYPVFSFFLAC